MMTNPTPPLVAEVDPQVSLYGMISYLARQAAQAEHLRALERAELECLIVQQREELDALKAAQQPANVEGAPPALGEGGAAHDH